LLVFYIRCRILIFDVERVGNKNETKTETSLLAQETALRAAIQHMLAAASTQTDLIIVVTISRPNTAYREGLILPPCPGYCCTAEKKKNRRHPKPYFGNLKS
jgi:hypothetical protein